MVSALNETSKWAKFIAILGFVGIGIMVIVSLAMGLFMGDTNAFIGGYEIILYLGIAVFISSLFCIYTDLRQGQKMLFYMDLQRR